MSKDTIHVFNNMSIKGLVANGFIGSTGQALLSNGVGVYWGSGAGFTGSRGDLGFTGSQGDIGFTGSKGDIGFTGSKGDIGYTGSQGDIGYTGSKGDIGYTGSQGDIGYTGSQGDIGYTGSASTVVGYTGSQGDIGFTGSASTVIGYTGSQGDIGFTGSKGDIGFTGSASTVIGYTGSQGDIGYTGSRGDVGFTGSRGDLGFTGSQGDIGYTGSKGDIGYTGSKGDIGYTGSQGDIGYTGSRGDVGFTGSQGPAGPSSLPQNPTGTTYGNGVSTVPPNMLSQAVGDNDGWRIYGEAPATNQVRMVFELVDDIEESLADQWAFRNKRTYTDYAARNEFFISGTGYSESRISSRAPIFYDSANTEFYGDFAGTSNLLGLTVTNTITGSITGNAGTVTNGLYTSGDQNTITGTKRFYSTNNTQINTVAAADRGLSVFQETASADAYMTFHVSGDYAAYFGLGGAENDLVYGGWSAGANRHRILHSGNYTSWAPSLTGSGASGNWAINVTGTAASISGFNNPTTAPTASTIAYRDAAGDIAAREIVLSSGLSEQTPTVLTSMYPTTNQLVRTTPAAVAVAIRGAASGSWGINVTGTAASTPNPTFAGDATNRADLTTRVDSGFYEHDTVTTAEGWPYNGTWMHMIAATHSNDANYFSMQIAADFFSNNPFYRSVNNNGATAWNRFALYNNGYSGNLYANIFYDNDNNAFYTDPDGNNRLRNLNLGGGSGFDATLHIVGSQGGYDRLTQMGPNAAAKPGLNILAARDGSNADLWWSWGPTAANVWCINSGVGLGTGGIQITTAGALTAADNITAYSDIKLKKNIELIPNALEKVLSVRGVTFERIDTGNRGAGVIAQEIEKILPEVVMENEDGIKSVAYGNMVGLLIEAIKEQQAHINRLEQRIDRG